MLRKHYKRLKSKFSRAKSFADDLNKERGIVRSRVALLLRSAEIKPLFSDLSHFFLKYANILPCPLNLISSHRLGRAIACMSNGLHPSVAPPGQCRVKTVVLKNQGVCYAAKYISVSWTRIYLKLCTQHNTVMLSNILIFFPKTTSSPFGRGSPLETGRSS